MKKLIEEIRNSCEIKKWLKGIAIGILVVIVAWFVWFAGGILFQDPMTHNCYEEAFGKEIYAELEKGYSLKDKQALEPLVDQVEKALNFIGTEKQAKKKFGELAYYCMTDEDAVTVEADVKFVTAKLMNDTGYLWVEYTQLGYDKKGKLTCGSSEIKSRITVVKFDEEWEAVNIKEAP